MAVKITVSPGLEHKERQQLLRRALVFMAHSFGYVEADETSCRRQEEEQGDCFRHRRTLAVSYPWRLRGSVLRSKQSQLSELLPTAGEQMQRGCRVRALRQRNVGE